MRIEVVGFEHFLNMPGWSVDRLVFSGKDLQVEVHRDRRRTLACPWCHGAMTAGRSQSHRVRDIGIGPDCPMWIIYTTTQGRCPPCGHYHTEHPPGVEGRSTIRFQRWVSSLCRIMTLQDAGLVASVDPATAWRMDDRHLKRNLPEPCLDGLTRSS